MPRITDAELQEWQELCDKATEGPWVIPDHTAFNQSIGSSQAKIRAIINKPFPYRDALKVAYVWIEDTSALADNKFITESRTAVPRLIAAVRELRAELQAADKLAEAVDKLRSGRHDSELLWMRLDNALNDYIEVTKEDK